MLQLKTVLNFAFLFLIINSCTFNGGSYNSHDRITDFITGTADIEKIKDVHIVNLARAIGAPSNSTTIAKYKYYQWNHSRTFGVSTLFGGGSTTLYCSMTAETQNDKIKLINWYGNQCGIFLDPIGEYFKNKLNIAVITDEDEKKQNAVTPIKSSDTEIDLRQKTTEQKTEEKLNTAEKPVN